MTMNNFQLIDNNKLASAKQVYAVACHFANIQSKNPSERYGLTKVFNAILNKFYSDQDAKMTHGEVTDFFEHQEVPKQFKTLIKKPKASKKVKTQTVQQAEIALDSKKPKTSKKIAAKNSVAKDLDNRVNALETKVSGMDSKLDAMLKILQAK